MAMKKGLGRGLDALIPGGNAASRPVRRQRQQGKNENPVQKNRIEKQDESEQKKEPEAKIEPEQKKELEQVKEPEQKKEPEAKTEPEQKKEPEVKTEPELTKEPEEKIEPEQVKEQGQIKESETKTEPEQKKGPEMIVPVYKVEPNREQPRKKFNEDALLELAESVKQYGVLQPLLVSDKKDYYEIIAGERRWRAAKLAGLKEIPVIVKEFTPLEILEISLIENIQREDLNPIEEATAYRRLIDEFHMKQDEVAEKVSKSRTAVTNSMRLLKLEKEVQQMLIDEMISAGHARALLAIPQPDAQIALANRIFEEKLSVREIERMVRLLVDPKPQKEEKPEQSYAESAAYEKIEERMREILGTRVSIHRKKNNKGKIEIEYYSGDELERIIDLLSSIQ